MTPEERDALLANHPGADADQLRRDLWEYERLLTCVFASDPSGQPLSPFLAGLPAQLRQRLRELHQRLFKTGLTLPD